MVSTATIDFSNTEVAFAHLTDSELKKTYWLFLMMSKPWLVKFGSGIGLWAVENGLPMAERVIRRTVFEQFVGGATLLDCVPSIERLGRYNVLTILDYGAEAKESEEDFNLVMNENIRSIEFAAGNAHIPVISTKITGIARFGLLESIQNKQTLSRAELNEYRNVLKRLDVICYHAANKGVAVFIDAEETWIQDAIDHGNVWKYYNHQPLSFAGIKEEAEFFQLVGQTEELRNPANDIYSWTAEEVLAAITNGTAHGFSVSSGFFGSGPHIGAKRFKDEALGKRVAKATLEGCAVAA
jgi:hypothetical protein